MMAKGMPNNTALGAAYQMLDQSATKQATLLAYIDVFLWVGITFLVCVPFILFFIKTSRNTLTVATAAH
jgi:DHA2 family multidrug resistance protein